VRAIGLLPEMSLAILDIALRQFRQFGPVITSKRGMANMTMNIVQIAFCTAFAGRVQYVKTRVN
jgi:hypothetical protein